MSGLSNALSGSVTVVSEFLLGASMGVGLQRVKHILTLAFLPGATIPDNSRYNFPRVS